MTKKELTDDGFWKRETIEESKMKMYEKYMNKELEELKRNYESDVEAISGAWEEFRHTGNCNDISCKNCPFKDDNVDCSSESIMIEKLNEELDNDDI